MKVMLSLMTLFCAQSVFAAQGYELKMKLSMNGEPVSAPHIMIKAGEKGMIEQGSKNGKTTFIEIVANEGEVQGRKGIMLNMVVGYIGDKGQKIVVSQPRIMTLANEEARVEQTDENGKDKMTLAIVAQRKTL